MMKEFEKKLNNLEAQLEPSDKDSDAVWKKVSVRLKTGKRIWIFEVLKYIYPLLLSFVFLGLAFWNLSRPQFESKNLNTAPGTADVTIQSESETYESKSLDVNVTSPAEYSMVENPIPVKENNFSVVFYSILAFISISLGVIIIIKKFLGK
jgi:hypothetical protein